jgi:hypothetical protein
MGLEERLAKIQEREDYKLVAKFFDDKPDDDKINDIITSVTHPMVPIMLSVKASSTKEESAIFIMGVLAGIMLAQYEMQPV